MSKWINLGSNIALVTLSEFMTDAVWAHLFLPLFAFFTGYEFCRDFLWQPPWRRD